MSRRMTDLSVRLCDVRKKEFNGGGEALRKRRDNMQVALSGMDRQQRQLRARMYAVQQEMLRDVVSKADVVRPRFLQFLWIFNFLISAHSLKVFVCRFVQRALRRRVWR